MSTWPDNDSIFLVLDIRAKLFSPYIFARNVQWKCVYIASLFMTVLEGELIVS